MKVLVHGYIRRIKMKFSEYIKEASEIKFDELPPEKKKLTNSISSPQNIQGVFDGIHGYIVNFRPVQGKHAITKKEIRGNAVRLDKKDLQKIITDKNFRWLDVSSMGF